MLNGLTTEQILDLAYTKGTTFDAIAFAEKIAELEREACAMVCDDPAMIGMSAEDCAAAIRMGVPETTRALILQEWQPIETAPKDERILLLFDTPIFTDINVAIGKWKDDRYASNPRPYWTHDRERSVGTRETRKNQPTHWMPLPSGPASLLPMYAKLEMQRDELVKLLKKAADEIQPFNRLEPLLDEIESALAKVGAGREEAK